MTSPARLKLDFHDDPTIIRGQSDIPDFVRKTSVVKSSELRKQGSANFALIMMMPDGSILPKFHVGSPGDTWLSVRAFEKNAHKLPVAMQETVAWYLQKACREWRVKAATDERLEKIAGQAIPPSTNVVQVRSGEIVEDPVESIKTATARFNRSLTKLGSDWFAIITTDSGGEVKRNYPLHTPNLVKKAAAWFDAHFAELKPGFRKMFSDNLMHAATRHGLVLESKEAFKYAGTRVSEDFETALSLRRGLVPNPEQARIFDQLLEKSASSLSPIECARVLELADQKLGLDKYWDGAIPDPYASVFAMPKLADYTYTTMDGDVSGSDLRAFVKRKNYRETLQAYVDKTIIDELERDPIEVFDHLPKPEKRLIMNLMRER